LPGLTASTRPAERSPRGRTVVPLTEASPSSRQLRAPPATSTPARCIVLAIAQRWAGILELQPRSSRDSRVINAPRPTLIKRRRLCGDFQLTRRSSPNSSPTRLPASRATASRASGAAPSAAEAHAGRLESLMGAKGGPTGGRVLPPPPLLFLLFLPECLWGRLCASYLRPARTSRRCRRCRDDVLIRTSLRAARRIPTPYPPAASLADRVRCCDRLRGPYSTTISAARFAGRFPEARTQRHQVWPSALADRRCT